MRLWFERDSVLVFSIVLICKGYHFQCTYNENIQAMTVSSLFLDESIALLDPLCPLSTLNQQPPIHT